MNKFEVYYLFNHNPDTEWVLTGYFNNEDEAKQEVLKNYGDRVSICRVVEL